MILFFQVVLVALGMYVILAGDILLGLLIIFVGVFADTVLRD